MLPHKPPHDDNGLDIEGAWDNGPVGVYYHQVCKLKLFSSRKLDQALKRKEKLQKEKKDQSTSLALSQPQPGEKTRQTRQTTGLIRDKNLCIWCLKPEDMKHRDRDRWHIMQQLDAWYTFKRHTVHLDDMAMQERLVTSIKSTPDPFAVGIRYHRSCWKKCVIENLYKGSEQTNLHLHDVQLSEMFFHHIRTVILQQHKLYTHFAEPTPGLHSSSSKYWTGWQWGEIHHNIHSSSSKYWTGWQWGEIHHNKNYVTYRIP